MKRKAGALVVLILGVSAATALAANVSGDGTLVGSTGPDTITVGSGNDIVWGLGTTDGTTDTITVTGKGNGNDVIDAGGHCTGVAPGDYPNGLPGSGQCEHGQTPPDCGTANITIPGNGGGNDTVYGNCGPNSISFAGKGQGDSTFYVPGGPNTVTDNNGNDVIDLSGETSGPNTITTGAGDNQVYARNGQVDHINCGSRATEVWIDSNDTTNGKCTVEHSPQPARDIVTSTRVSGRTQLRRTTHVKKHLKKTSHRSNRVL